MASTTRLLGDEGELFARHHATLHARVARWVNTSSANVDDACAIAWLQLVRCQPRSETALSWLTTVAIREAVRLDRGHRRVCHIDVEVLGNRNVLDPQPQRDALDALDALAGLPERQRRLAALQAAGFTYDEIAQLTGCTRTAVDRHLRRAHEGLRQALRADLP
jgi:RNA polymerase sigma factor (sigma-70 family)